MSSPIFASRRKWAPKGRGGCSTCRLRHVRCDGKKPMCTPCKKSSRLCEHSSGPNLDQLKVVLWKPTRLNPQRIVLNPDHTSDEVRAFDFFRTKVATNLGGFFESEFWSRDVLQFAQQEPSARHAVVALASLSESMLKATPTSSMTPTSELFALRQHAKAISKLKQRLNNNNESSQQAVIVTCVLFICFDMFHNDYESALRQMSSGMYLFCDWHNKLREIRMLNLPGYINELAVPLQHVFERLMLQTTMFIETRPSDWKFIAPEFSPPIPTIPSTFRSIEEARDYLVSCLCSIYFRVLLSQLGRLENDATSEVLVSQPTGDPLHYWMVSFDSFIIDKISQLSFKEQQSTIILRIQQITGTIFVDYLIAFSQEIFFDSFELDFCRVVDLASSLIFNNGEGCLNRSSACPTFDIGLLPYLYFVASRCRHPTIRRQALHLLRNGPRQEGVWHRDVLLGVAERIIEIEEMDCVGASISVDIPATARVSLLNAKINSAKRIVALHYRRPKLGDLTSMEVLHDLVKY
ncbi:hypothetical protein K505DRAFT_376027 [Melanomma pulvis-pyrius CBS 109.77]|uniref:Zn(2)-C6 fungal-type domain-containing protein n=1 Tax=Melanomma pulvis-pyrius CBS 109.77 TaxID=1314802 RepID=A0A6A6X925_9PLEO|nr:hypothetical protein K505DRAFT_376027 [Melanomma pulvis-pyrius CBS 109.77]